MKNVAIVGVGYVGLTQAVGMAQLGHKVVAYDVDKTKIEKLKKGTSPFFEPGLEDALLEGLNNNLIRFTDNVEEINTAEYIFLCLPTPQGEGGEADIAYLISAVKSISPKIISGAYLIIKSTVPMNTWKVLGKALNRDDAYIISNPEFLREGSAILYFNKPDRIVIGAKNDSLAQKVADLYQKISTEIIITDNTSAELIKYAANSFLAMKLSFVNDIDALCETLNADSKTVLKGVGLDNRIGNKFMTPGPGWGGSCFPKDVNALIQLTRNEGTLIPLLDATLQSNENAQIRVVRKIEDFFNNNYQKKITILGLAFKSNTDDTRNSPAVNIAKILQSKGFDVVCFDPVVKKVSELTIVHNFFEAVDFSDLLLILTEWDEFSALDPNDFIDKVRSKNYLDTRNILNKNKWTDSGFISL